MRLHSIRTEYKYAELSESSIEKLPFKQFGLWLDDAINAKVKEPTAMSVVTIGIDGYPDSRIVLLKEMSENGFIFFTSYQSNKARSIEINTAVGLHFFWPELERQVRISGYAEKTSPDISDQYFYSRPLPSQVAAMVSNQSGKISSRRFLQEKFEEIKLSYAGKSIKRPENWGGFLVKPVKFEFWQGRENRLHDRILYEKTGTGWLISRLAP